jgi:hypothetical protein
MDRRISHFMLATAGPHEAVGIARFARPLKEIRNQVDQGCFQRRSARSVALKHFEAADAEVVDVNLADVQPDDGGSADDQPADGDAPRASATGAGHQGAEAEGDALTQGRTGSSGQWCLARAGLDGPT